MRKKPAVTKADLQAGKKRVNLTLSIPEFDDLFLVAEYNKINYTTLANSLVIKETRAEAAKIRKTDYVPIAQRGGNLFENKKEPKKKINKSGNRK